MITSFEPVKDEEVEHVADIVRSVFENLEHEEANGVSVNEGTALPRLLYAAAARQHPNEMQNPEMAAVVVGSSMGLIVTMMDPALAVAAELARALRKDGADVSVEVVRPSEDNPFDHISFDGLSAN